MRRLSLKFFRRFCHCHYMDKQCRNEVGNLKTENVKFKLSRTHTPVMVNEVIEQLNLRPQSLLLDMTFGAGGHSSALLERIPDLRVLALDRDPISRTYADELSRTYPGRVTPLTGKFSDLPTLLNENKISNNSIDGILFDLGCSSMQFDTPERGFSVNKCGPLDMRMDGTRVPKSITAADVVAYASETELAKIFKIYGQERRAKLIARAIDQSRSSFRPLQTTQELSELVETVCSSDTRHDQLGRQTNVATKIFQALRIFVNNELNELNYGLLLANMYLKVGGKAVAISFHSLEDTIVKRHFHNQLFNNETEESSSDQLDPLKSYPKEYMENQQPTFWMPVTRKVILPTDEEVFVNPRSRSAKLRAAVKLKTITEWE